MVPDPLKEIKKEATGFGNPNRKISSNRVSNMKNNFNTLQVSFDEETNTATVVINRADKLNALNNEVLSELEDLFYDFQKSKDVYGAYITGAGDKAFAAGADIGEFTDLNSFRGAATSEKGQEIFQVIENSPFPVVAVIEGFALGGGLELALACHLRVASRKAQFGQPEVSLGLIPGYGGTQRLPRLIGKSRATELILTGKQISADLALAYGLINRMADDGEALAEAWKLMGAILDKGPLAVKNALQILNSPDNGTSRGYQEEADAFGELCGTDDFREGTNAFLEKRKPNFKGS